MLNLQKSEFYIFSEINLDLLQIRSKSLIENYADNLMVKLIKCFTNKPARMTKNSKVLIENVYTNNLDVSHQLGIS